MLPLNQATLAQLPPELDAPRYDRAALRAGIVHIGVGGFHRSHEAAYLDDLFRLGRDLDWAIRGVGVLPGDRAMADALNAQDGLYTLVVKHPDGTTRARVVGSLLGVDHLLDDPDAVLAALTDPATRIVSLTITEGGYPASPDTLAFDPGHPSVGADLARPDAAPTTVFGLLVRALVARRERGVPPFTVLSCDNVQHNGTVARASVLGMAERYAPGHAAWLGESVDFPNSMVDRITPGTTDADRAQLADAYGLADRRPVTCEPFTQWVVEDRFAQGRPRWEEVGVQFTADVEPYEFMKLRMLNAGHQLIGHLGRHLGLTHTHEALRHPALRAVLDRFLSREAIPTVPRPDGVDLTAYRDSLLERFGNPEVRDSLARLCAYASDRIPKFLLGTVRDNAACGGDLDCAALVLAAWALGSRAADERGRPIEVTDPQADALRAASLRERVEPGAFLGHPVFGDLGRDERVRAAYLTALARLQEQGTEAALRAALDA